MTDPLDVEVVPPVRSDDVSGLSTLPQHLMTCLGGTTFALFDNDQVEILRSDQSICQVPLADLVQFVKQVI